MNMDKKTRAAWHEAGHVVSYFAYRWRVTSANIKEWMDGTTPVCGQTFTEAPTDLSVEDLLHSDMTCTLAGPLAGQKAAGLLPGTLTAQDVDFHDDAHRVLARVVQITADKNDARKIVDECRKEAVEFIALQWSAITAVATALLEKTELDEAALKELCEAALTGKIKTTTAPAQPPVTTAKAALKRLKKRAPAPPVYAPKHWVEGEDYKPA